MSFLSSPPRSRLFDFRIGLAVPIGLMALLLVFEPSNIDFLLSQLFYTPESGFFARRSVWFEDILHDRAKQAVIVLAFATLGGFLLSLVFSRLRPWRRQLGYVVVALALSTAIVSPLKTLTAVHCPWDLAEFGGEEIYTSLLDKRAPTEKPGRCWPGGHASAGFSLLALYFALRDRHPRAARSALIFALALGSLFSFGRIVQGAHFLSHNLWTLLFDWTICVLCYRWLLYRAPTIDSHSYRHALTDSASRRPAIPT